MTPGTSFKSTEFFALFLAHVFVPVVLLIKPELIDSNVIMTILGADITYILGRSGVKALSGKNDVKTELKNLLKEAKP